MMGTANRKATEEELKQMENIVRCHEEAEQLVLVPG